MPVLGKRSLERLNTCDPKLQELIKEAIKVVDFTVLCGHRTQEEQDKAVAEGKSKVKWPNGKHNTLPSKAVDIAPYPIDWNNRDRFILLAGVIKGIAHSKGIAIRWGGDWNGNYDLSDEQFSDMPHFELIE